MTNFYVINHDKTNFSYEVLAQDNDILSIIERDTAGNLSVKKAWVENGILNSRTTFTRYESYEEYLEKLPELEGMLDFSTIEDKLLQRYNL